MKNRFSLLEVGGSLIFFGLTMCIFPDIFHTSYTHQSNNDISLMIEGCVLICVGIILMSIKRFKKNK